MSPNTSGHFGDADDDDGNNGNDEAETDVDFALQEKLERLEEGILGDLGRQVSNAINYDDDNDTLGISKE